MTSSLYEKFYVFPFGEIKIATALTSLELWPLFMGNKRWKAWKVYRNNRFLEYCSRSGHGFYRLYFSSMSWNNHLVAVHNLHL